MPVIEIAQLPIAALILVGFLTFFGLLARGTLRWNREIQASQASEADWKATAQKATATSAELAGQVAKLTEVVSTLTRIVEQRVIKT